MDMKDETLLLLQRITEQYGSVNRLAKELGIPSPIHAQQHPESWH